MSRFFVWLIKIAIAILLSCLLMGWFQNLHPIFDAFSSFRLHFILLLMPLLLVALLARQWRWFTSGIVLTTASLYVTAPYLPGFQPTPPNTENLQQIGSDGEFSIVQFNMRFNNRETDQAIQSITAVNPDIYLVQELTQTTRPIFDSIQKTHPHIVDCSSPRVGSVATASRHPLDPSFPPICNRRDGLVIARYLLGDQAVTVASLHLRWPWPFLQHLQINRIKNVLTDLSGPFILAGDFNAAPWTNAVQRVSRITDSRPAPGLLFTWTPRFLEFDIDLLPILPIDQILMREAYPISRTRLADGGSDHFPVHTKFKLKQ